MKSIRTDTLEIAYEEAGPENGSPIVLLHGWPDAPRGWSAVARPLHDAGWRTITPWLRGLRPTRFLDQHSPRDGSGVALAQDAIDLADALALDRFAVVGHDWGARIAYTLAALFPERLTAIVALALAFQPRGVFKVPGFAQSRRFWYQWLQCIDGGAEKVRENPIAFARIQWDTWSPPGWFDEAEFAKTASDFSDPDWVAITLNAYRKRWLQGEETDPRYAAQRQKLAEIESISTPTLMIQGGSDFCDDPKESEGLDGCFKGEYRRVLLEGIGHFPHREAPVAVSGAILDFLRELRLEA